MSSTQRSFVDIQKLWLTMLSSSNAMQRVQAKINARRSNPYLDEELASAQDTYSPQKNKEYEQQHCVKQQKADDNDNDKNYKNVWSDSSYNSSSAVEEEEVEQEDNNDRLLIGNEANTEKLVTKYVRDHESSLALDIPNCIHSLCFAFSYDPTDVKFEEWDDRISPYISVSNEGKIANISSRTVYLFSSVGYSTGFHIWHVKCHNVYNCQALGIAEHKNPKYRYGDNIFDTTLNEQLGDRYIYAGDSGHSWRGSNDLRPYVCSVIGEEEYYSKRLNLKNAQWRRGDIITVELNLGSGKKDDDTKRTIQFLKNGKALCEPIRVVKQCAYYPIFQCYQRGMFEIIDHENIYKEEIYERDVVKCDDLSVSSSTETDVDDNLETLLLSQQVVALDDDIFSLSD